MQENLIISKKERLQYIDALRGLAMIMVVFVHVEVFSFFNFTHTTALMYMLSAIHMPLFFFISGLCAYNPDKIYGFPKVKNDFYRLIIPAIVIGLLYTYFKLGEDFVFFFANSMKAGYWFTFSLFEILLIYYAISNLTKKNRKAFMLVMWTFAVLLYILKLPFKTYETLEVVGNYLCLHQTFNYFIYFALGITISKYKERVESLFGYQSLITLILVLFIAVSVLVFNIFPDYATDTVKWRVLDTLGETVVGVFGVLLLYITFNKTQTKFSRSGMWQRGVILVGNNTLAIYLIHYFLLPTFPQVGSFLLDYHSLIVELMVGCGLTVIIVVLSITVNRIIEFLCPSFGRFILGNK